MKSMNGTGTCKTPSTDRSFSNNKGCGLPLGNAKAPGSTTRGRKTPGKTPGKNTRMTPSRNPNISGNKTPMGDRFIPNRSGSQFELAHFMFTSASATNLSQTGNLAEASNLSPRTQEFQRVMRENLNGGVTAPDAKEASVDGSRIFSYQNKAAMAPQGYVNPNKVLYSHRTGPASPNKKLARHIPSQPDKVLDAPSMLDDYYLNLLDWSHKNVLAVALTNQLYLWNATSAEINLLLELDGVEYVSSLSWLHDGNYLAVGTSKGDIQLWDVETTRRLRTMAGHSERVGALAWNRHLLSSGSRSGAVFTHDVRIAQHLISQPATAHTQEVCGLKWSPDHRYLASGGNDNIIKIWSEQSLGEAVHTFTEHTAAVKALAWCPWQPSVLASGGGTADRQIRFWNCNNFSSLSSIDAQSQVCSLLWSSYYKELISAHGYPSFQLSMWKYPALTKVTDLTGHTARVLHMVMSPCGEYVVSAAADETLRIWKCFGIDPATAKKMTEKKSTLTSTLLQRFLKVHKSSAYFFHLGLQQPVFQPLKLHNKGLYEQH